MAKNFGNAGSAKTIKEVEKASAEKAQVVTIKMIADENLIDCPMNKEDTEYTEDIEQSIDEIGFADPLDVTTFQQSTGKYMIVSGHRRRMAGRKKGITVFPCIVKSFSSWNELENYLLLINGQRKDPLLFCKRYKNHEDYLIRIGFKGNVREQVAKRLGISTPQADRYNTMNKVILPVWDMVREEKVGMSSVMPMAKHTPDEQAQIYDIMQEALKADVALTRDTMKKIVKEYRDGKKTWSEIADLPKNGSLPLDGFINTEASEINNRNDEIQREFDPIGAEADKVDAEHTEWDRQQAEQSVLDSDDSRDKPEHKSKEEKPSISDEEKRAKDIQKDLEKLNICLNDIYTFESRNEAEETLRNMASTFITIIDEMYNIAREYKINDIFHTSLEEMKTKVIEYEK